MEKKIYKLISMSEIEYRKNKENNDSQEDTIFYIATPLANDCRNIKHFQGWINVLLSFFMCISIAFIIYKYNCYSGEKNIEVVSLITDYAIAYQISYVFFFITVILPNAIDKYNCRAIIDFKISAIAALMFDLLNMIVSDKYEVGIIPDDFDNTIKNFSLLDFNKSTFIYDVTTETQIPLNIEFERKSKEIKSKIDEVINKYWNYISPDQIYIFEQIEDHFFHSDIIGSFCVSKDRVYDVSENKDIMVKYNDLRKQLLQTISNKLKNKKT